MKESKIMRCFGKFDPKDELCQECDFSGKCEDITNQGKKKETDEKPAESLRKKMINSKGQRMVQCRKCGKMFDFRKGGMGIGKEYFCEECSKWECGNCGKRADWGEPGWLQYSDEEGKGGYYYCSEDCKLKDWRERENKRRIQLTQGKRGGLCKYCGKWVTDADPKIKEFGFCGIDDVGIRIGKDWYCDLCILKRQLKRDKKLFSESKKTERVKVKSVGRKKRRR